MAAKTTIALSIALMIGAVSTASAQYDFDSSGAPIDMHIVDDQLNTFASTGSPSRARAEQPRASFSAEEKMLFDRTSRPHYLGEEQQY